jgi:hypothetical protein
MPRRAAGEDALTPALSTACATEEDTTDAGTEPSGRKTHHREVRGDTSRPLGRKKLAAAAEPRRTRSQCRPWGGGGSMGVLGVGLRRGRGAHVGRRNTRLKRPLIKGD